ncbi:rhomboid 4, putative [Babesia bigemina]|uniref:Rhomboid-like protease n=1 Tax=Babesia bigemina TaxID=5866 RepID=A0A061CZP6_BABBI|nr:rhomboid 4, putative [Babesia bigemina]CDR94096.1 rhomboid 4, putative [Babesia bigemina]|eukprot:XP_012766282.1 rhomboid 4, putative [Babesia bigemina]
MDQESENESAVPSGDHFVRVAPTAPPNTMPKEMRGKKKIRNPNCCVEKRAKTVIDRRAPINPLEKLGLMSMKTSNVQREIIKGSDPMLERNPLVGRLPFMLIINATLVLVFISELVFNKLSFNGRCISKVLYPTAEAGKDPIMPYAVELGYGACEYNLNTSAANRFFFGNDAADSGWPAERVNPELLLKGDAAIDAPNERVFQILGGSDANMARNYNEYFRLIWSMFMHSSWKHLLFNVFCQVQALWIIEPDWGFLRTLTLFIVSGVGGNLMAAVLDPCGTTVGSSGAMYGLYGAMIPYCIEYWNTIPRPVFLMFYNLVTLIVGFVIGLSSNVDNYCHMVGGCLFGMLWGFTTIKSVSSCDKCTLIERSLLSPLISWALPRSWKAKLRLTIVFKKDRGERRREAFNAHKMAVESGVSMHRIAQIKKKFERNGAPPCRMRLREWFIRLTSLLTMISLVVLASLFLVNPALYSKYKPPGQYKFGGWRTCDCCYVTNIHRLFKTTDHITESYRNSDLFWCFNDVENAKHYCGEDYADNGPSQNVFESTEDAALGILSTVRTAINSV